LDRKTADSPQVTGIARLEGEPAIWYSRFQRWLNAGPQRSMRSIYLAETGRADGSLPGAWKKAALRWRWVERAKEYDDMQFTAAQDQFEERRAAAREARQQALSELQALLAGAIAEVKAGKRSLKEIAAIAEIIHRLSVNEFEPLKSGITINNSNSVENAVQPTVIEIAWRDDLSDNSGYGD
jgi:hypothetical protein